MGAKHSGYKKLEEEHEFTPSSSWQRKQPEGETSSESVPEASNTEQIGPKLQQSKGAEAKKDGEKK